MRFNTMPNLRRAAIPSALLTLSLISLPSMACRVLTKEEAERRRPVIVEEAKSAIAALHEEADQVFVGRLSKLTSREEGDDSGREGSSWLKLYQAEFESVENVKGLYTPEQALGYTVNMERVVVGCGLPVKDVRLRASEIGQQYIVYARKGEILRANHIPLQHDALTAGEELVLVRSLRK